MNCRIYLKLRNGFRTTNIKKNHRLDVSKIDDVIAYNDSIADKESSVVMTIHCANFILKYYLPIKIKPRYWNRKKSRVINSKDHHSDELNTYIDKAIWKTQKLTLSLANNNTLSKEKLREELHKEFRGIVKTDISNFWEFCKDFIKTSNKSYGTKKNYRHALNIFKDYEVYSKTNISFENIDLTFYNNFVNYLFKERNYCVNSVGRHIKLLKVFLNDATDRGINTNLAFKSSRFKVLKEDVDFIYLNEEELRRMYNLDLSDNKRLEKVRDLFIVGAYTALRISDLKRIDFSNVRDNLIHIRTQKTSEYVVIPIHSLVKEIFNKYKDSSLPSMCEQKFNKYIKEVAKLAGINESVKVVKTNGGIRKTIIKKKYELVSSHCGRRSAATNMIISGIPALSIMKITGHKSHKVFSQYVRLSNEHNAKLIGEHKFFS